MATKKAYESEPYDYHMYKLSAKLYVTTKTEHNNISF